MPNWVYNNVTILGSESDLSKFYDKATALHPVEFDAETGEFVMTTEPEFSFWNFVSPPVEALKSGEYWGTHGFTDGKPQGNTENNWYHWNIREWGVKWNANNAYFSEDFGSRSISGSYDTAWSIPEPVMTAMVEQHPELVFIFHCEEEQGWGAEYSGENGRLVLTREFDVPSSHADYVERDNEDGCACAYSDDEDDWYGDCPRPERSSLTCFCSAGVSTTSCGVEVVIVVVWFLVLVAFPI